MISLADLRARNVLPSWQEAVAIVQELLHTVLATHGTADRMPDLEHVALIANGDVVSLPGSPVPQNPVRHLAILLNLLLDGVPTPPELQAFIERNIQDPPQHETAEEFAQGLAFFERPGRRADVERLVARAIASEAQTRADDELRRLKARAEEAARGWQSDASAAGARREHKRRVGLPLAAASGAVILATAGIAAWWAMHRPQASPVASVVAEAAVTVAPPQPALTPALSTAPAEADAAPAAAVSPATVPADGGPPSRDISMLSKARQTLSSVVNAIVRNEPAPAVPPPPATTPPAATATPKPVSRPAARRAPVRPAPPASSTATPIARNGSAAAPAPAAVLLAPAVGVPPLLAPPTTFSEVSAAVAAVREATIYTSADTDVVPAILIRPVLPATPPPDVRPDQIGAIDLLVNEDGDVERVRLVSPSNRFHERMILSNAKTWKFSPAMRNGQPVRYWARVRLTGL